MILHIDMDAFYASVEQLDNPELKGKPVIVGGLSGRGVVSAASYEARRFGVRSAMPVFQARRKCPDGVFLSPRRERYADVSRQILGVFREFSPLVEQVSIDEAYMDITGCQKLYGAPETIAASIKKSVRERVSLTCSVGAAPVRFAAKIASDMKKPDGLVVIRPEDLAGFIQTIPIEKVPGVGRVTLEILKQLNIAYLGDVQRISKTVLTGKLGKYGQRLYDLSAGVDRTPVVPDHTPKSAGSESTLSADTVDRELIKRHILGHCEHVARDLRKLGVKAGTITIKIKHSDFKTVTRSASQSIPVFSSELIYRAAVSLFDAYPIQQPVRLVGVSASNFKTGNHFFQSGLFDGDAENRDHWEAVDQAMDMIRGKFGHPVIGRAAALLDREDRGGEVPVKK